MEKEVLDIEKTVENSSLLKIISIILIIFLSYILIKIIEKAISKSLEIKLPTKFKSAKLNTIIHTIYAFIKFIIIFISAIIILDLLGVNTSSLLATAGIGGIALAFGTQTLVEDVVKGIFLVLDDEINVGDYITVAGVSGNVESVSLRNTVIRDYDGSLYYVPNSQIKVVKNSHRGNQKADIYLYVSYEEKVSDIKRITKEVSKIAKEKIDFKVDPFFVGIDCLGEFSYKVLVSSEVKTGMQWKAQRLLRELFKEKFEENNISTNSRGNYEKI
ncbi:MAG: mechanosensitive ion channel family protein [Peptoniphilaceae bacterium]|nr:mechanosensitive ion channel family protein [Peptoniphilaceae bacterium]MDD7383186.1 mechanosensitive ion channel family protein [Peptoniphilaceae bacterium]MDY3738410.1 mechanosensitive ion channel family protein [Peptoniphilaceae bacterium]